MFCDSAHTCLIDKPINDAFHIVTKYLCPTLTDNLFILKGIQPTELCCQKPYCLKLTMLRARTPLTCKALSAMQQLKSRHPFVPASLVLLNNPIQSGSSLARWAECK